ncbi:MAG: segregation/condensation protein A [Peptostreptococcaceae bacterium]|nr:segregation/condensation protein A [Peptostreptococcaceae bacterium]
MYKVKLETFEGPFDLLVYLIENAKMSIYDIKVAMITKQYVSYLEDLDELDIEVATEFIVLAAILIDLKSKMLIPRLSESGEALIEEDPRFELVHRLEEYKLTKKRAEMLTERMDYFANVYEKPQEDISEFLENPDEFLNLDIEQFAKAFMLFIERKQKISEVRKSYQNIEKRRNSIEERIIHIAEMLKSKSNSEDIYNFNEFVPNAEDNYEIALTFVSLLELIKEQEIEANQEKIYGDILVKKIKDNTEEEIEQ